jgi:hypothetical protein
MDFEEMLNQRLTALMDRGPITYSDEGIAMIQKVVLDVWNELDPIECLQ